MGKIVGSVKAKCRNEGAGERGERDGLRVCRRYAEKRRCGPAVVGTEPRVAVNGQRSKYGIRG